MRIAAVLQELDGGGSVASCCLNQLAVLAHSHQCFLITTAGSGEEPVAMPAPVRVRRLFVPRLGLLHRFAHVPRQILFILLVGVALCRWNKRERPDLVLFHSHPPTAVLAPLLHKVLGCRVAMVMHGDIRDRPAGTYDPRLTWWYRVTTPVAYRSADAVLALSPYMAQWAIAGGADSGNVYLTPNGVDADEIGADMPPTAPLGEGLLYVGRLEHNKGVDLLIEAFCRIAPQWPALRLTCIGSSSHAFRLGLDLILGTARLSDRVTFLPPLSRKLLGRFYRESVLVVIPSRSETQSTVAMEAMAAGRAVLASNTGGNPMLVDVPRTGLLFTNGDADDLTERLEQLLRSPAELAAMGHAGYQRHQAHFSRQRAGERLQVAVDRLTGRR